MTWFCGDGFFGFAHGWREIGDGTSVNWNRRDDFCVWRKKSDELLNFHKKLSLTIFFSVSSAKFFHFLRLFTILWRVVYDDLSINRIQMGLQFILSCVSNFLDDDYSFNGEICQLQNFSLFLSCWYHFRLIFSALGDLATQRYSKISINVSCKS